MCKNAPNTKWFSELQKSSNRNSYIKKIPRDFFDIISINNKKLYIYNNFFFWYKGEEGNPSAYATTNTRLQLISLQDLS